MWRGCARAALAKALAKQDGVAKSRDGAVAAVAAGPVPAVAEAPAAVPAPVAVAAVSARRRAVAEARGQVVSAILAHAGRVGCLTGQAIGAFLAAEAGHAAWLAAVAARDGGEFLTVAHKLRLKEGSPMEGVAGPGREGFGVPAAVLELANDRARRGDAFRGASRATLYAWVKAYAAGGLEALVPAATRQEEPIPDDFRRFMKIYARPAKPRVAQVHAEYVAQAPEGVVPLSLSQVEYVLRHKLDHIERNRGREGPLALRARMAFVARDTSDLLPGTIYVGDGHTFDARIADPVSGAPMRPELTSIMDVATRKVVGWAMSRKENVVAVTEAMRNACVAHCVPAVAYFDRGAGYKNKRFDDEGNGLMVRLGITKAHALPYGSQAKGNIERLHQSLWIPFARELPTYLGADMDSEARMRVDRQLREDRRVAGRSRLLMGWEEFRAEVARLVDAYNARPHGSLPKIADPATGRMRHMSPDEYWQFHVAQGFAPVPVDPFTADDLFRPYEKRRVSRCLVRLWTNEYFSLDLNPWHERDVYVGYDYAQADRVWVREIDPVTRDVGRLICVAAYGGNRVSYMPRSFIEAAMEKRTQGRLRRNEVRRAAIEEERGPVAIEHEAVAPAAFDRLPEAVPARQEVAAATEERAAAPAAGSGARPARRGFASDEELAAWALAHPGEVSATQLRVLRGCLADATARELFRLTGIDIEVLRELVRAAA